MCPDDNITGLGTPTWWAKMMVRNLFGCTNNGFICTGTDCPHHRTLLHLVPRLRMNGPIPLLLYMPAWRGEGKTFSGSRDK